MLTIWFRFVLFVRSLRSSAFVLLRSYLRNECLCRWATDSAKNSPNVPTKSPQEIHDVKEPNLDELKKVKRNGQTDGRTNEVSERTTRGFEQSFIHRIKA